MFIITCVCVVWLFCDCIIYKNINRPYLNCKWCNIRSSLFLYCSRCSTLIWNKFSPGRKKTQTTVYEPSWIFKGHEFTMTHSYKLILFLISAFIRNFYSSVCESTVLSTSGLFLVCLFLCVCSYFCFHFSLFFSLLPFDYFIFDI